jgi:hypothetical protein
VPEIKNGNEIHRGPCDCVRFSFHVVDSAGDLWGLAYDEKSAFDIKRRVEKKNPGLGALKVDKRSIYTIAKHVDDKGRMT